ncbi:hypothetical protein Bbelb_211070 [Branchiostoma belcheri]|nr:hypothetical protein Bbelb_211070 [Branchiostoma belcheri]
MEAKPTWCFGLNLQHVGCEHFTHTNEGLGCPTGGKGQLSGGEEMDVPQWLELELLHHVALNPSYRHGARHREMFMHGKLHYGAALLSAAACMEPGSWRIVDLTGLISHIDPALHPDRSEDNSYWLLRKRKPGKATQGYRGENRTPVKQQEQQAF